MRRRLINFGTGGEYVIADAVSESGIDGVHRAFDADFQNEFGLGVKIFGAVEISQMDDRIASARGSLPVPRHVGNGMP